MKKIIMGVILLFSMVILTACYEEQHSIQYGKVDNHGKIELQKTLTSEEDFKRLDEILKDSKNISILESDLDHLSKKYIQLTNDKQNMIMTNYIVWLDEENERYICYPFAEEKKLFYAVTERDYKGMKRVIEKVKESDEKLISKKFKKEGTPYQVTWSYSD